MNALLCQFFHGPEVVDPRPFLEQVHARSQRPMVATSCGDPFVFRPEVEWVLRADGSKANQRIDGLLNVDEGASEQLGRAGSCAVRFRHMDSHPTALMVRIMAHVRATPRCGWTPSLPVVDCLHQGVDMDLERPTAFRGW